MKYIKTLLSILSQIVSNLIIKQFDDKKLLAQRNNNTIIFQAIASEEEDLKRLAEEFKIDMQTMEACMQEAETNISKLCRIIFIHKLISL